MSNAPSAAAIWDERYSRQDRDHSAQYERWLDRWTDQLRQRRIRALDLGCGPGFDVSVLLGLGFDVTAIDHSQKAIALSARKNPGAHHIVGDLRNLDTLVVPPFSVVIANLSLHYFNRADTEKAFATIRTLLVPGGFFVFRVNANDEHGAPDNPEDWSLVNVEGVAKQFFTRTKIEHLLGTALPLLSIEKRTTDRFGRRKSLFEVAAVKPSTP